jgi:hypothetical protein
MSDRIYRDLVHNIIGLRTNNSEGELMMRLIDTREFQRLRLSRKDEELSFISNRKGVVLNKIRAMRCSTREQNFQ